MNHIINVPADNVVAGLLRQRCDELTGQLARLEWTRQIVESDLEALEQAIQVVVGGQRNRATASLPVTPPTSSVALVDRDTVRRRRGDLPAAVRRVLALHGALTPAGIRDHLPPEMRTGNKVSLCLGTMAVQGMVSGAAVPGSRRDKQWSLTDKGRRIAAKEGGAA